MTTELATMDVDKAQSAAEWLGRLLRSHQGLPAEYREAAERAVAGLSVPCDPVWLMARVGALLEPYYDKGTAHSFKVMEAEDWAAALVDFPAWAIQAAARWWKSAENTDRRKRPLEGDIAARCRIEMASVNAAMVYLRNPDIGDAKEGGTEPKRFDPGRAKRAQEIIDAAGFGKNVGGM